MRRLDVDDVDHARRAELDDALVVREIEAGFAWEHVAAPARFPAVHPFAAIGVLAFMPDRRGCMRQPLLGREELVGRLQDRGTQPRLGEIHREAREVRNRIGRIGHETLP